MSDVFVTRETKLPKQNITDPKEGSLSVADATALKAELATMRDNLTASTALNAARDTEMKALIAAKTAQDATTSSAVKAQETMEVQPPSAFFVHLLHTFLFTYYFLILSYLFLLISTENSYKQK